MSKPVLLRILEEQKAERFAKSKCTCHVSLLRRFWMVQACKSCCHRPASVRQCIYRIQRQHTSARGTQAVCRNAAHTRHFKPREGAQFAFVWSQEVPIQMLDANLEVRVPNSRPRRATALPVFPLSTHGAGRIQEIFHAVVVIAERLSTDSAPDLLPILPDIHV